LPDKVLKQLKPPTARLGQCFERILLGTLCGTHFSGLRSENVLRFLVV